MVELHGKGWRTVGYFAWMLGAGFVLDGGSTLVARLLLLTGFVSFVTGVWQSLRGDTGAIE